jgi:DNA topoisomerase-6 subunit B
MGVLRMGTAQKRFNLVAPTATKRSLKRSGKEKQKKATRGASAGGARGEAKTANTTAKTKGKANPDQASLPLFGPTPASPAAAKSSAETVPAKTVPARVAEGDDSEAAARSERAHRTAQAIGQKQREISISEFFAKNRHLLGFDSLHKALLTAVKEAVDNSLDACEEAALLPEVLVEIGEIAENRYRVVVEDSGPGIVKAQVPRIFGKLLYGSKFHILKQSRGQQGIGISAAVMYAQLTTGKPVKVVTRTGAKQPAHKYELQIDTKKNAPVIISDTTTDWDKPHGVRIEMEILATYKKGQRSVDAYLHQVAMANPHARLIYRSPKNPEVVYERLTQSLPTEAKAIKPHPHGVELGVMLDMLSATKARNVKGFLESEFSRMSANTSADVLREASVSPTTSPKRITRESAEAIIGAFGRTKIMKPPASALAPIGEELLAKSLERETPASFITSVTRPPAVYRGNPFQIEAAISYGGGASDVVKEGEEVAEEKGEEDELVRLYRFANRAPLIYQQSACAITQSVVNTAWKGYGVAQSRGALPSGPMAIVVHIASAWVPFTSESKEAIAHYPEIVKEIKLALQECGRRLALFLRKGLRAQEEAKKRSYIEQYIPHIGIALKEILGFSDREEKAVVDTLKTTLEKSRQQ